MAPRYPSFPPIMGDRIKLRLPRADDTQRLVELLNDRDVVQNLANVPYPYDQSAAIDFMHGSYRNMESGAAYNLYIEHRPTRDLIGGIGWDMGAGEIGYWIAKSHWGQGYATEAMQLAIGYCRAKNLCVGLRSIIAEDHAASRRVVEKCGFELTGHEIQKFPARGRLQRVAVYELQFNKGMEQCAG
jgi:RimJ/RimL family protein N-acetyltransferase